jgi:hypothetical protein
MNAQDSQFHLEACQPVRSPQPLKPIALFFLLILTLTCLPAEAKHKSQSTSQDPYATAEYETAPPVKAEDLAYRAVEFDDFTIPAEWESDARRYVDATIDQAISRLSGTHAFTTVGRKQKALPDDPCLVVKATLLNYRMVRTAARFWGGAFAGTSYITYRVQVYDGKTGVLLFQREISTENNAFAAAWSFNDKNLPWFLGNVFGDYLALRARKDMGVTVLPLTDVAQAASGGPAAVGAPAPQPATPAPPAAASTTP